MREQLMMRNGVVKTASKHAADIAAERAARDGVEQMELKRLGRENRELKRFLGNIAVVIAHTISALDAAMKGPSTEQRGKTIAAASSTLEHANDSLMHFGLKYDFKKINKIKRQLVTRSTRG